MTIKNISKLSEFGIFKNYTNAHSKDFGKYNLFYGWNGSGKSTISSLFRCIENQQNSEKFPSAEFLINIENDLTITQNNLNNSNLKIYTFNQDFINENISWNSIAKSILLVDKEKISERKKLEELTNQQKINFDIYAKESKEIADLENSISKFSTDSARHIKTSLQSIDTADSYYLNYDKRKFETFIEANNLAVQTENSILNNQRIIDLTNAAKPNQRPTIIFSLEIINEDIFTKAKSKLDELLKTNIISQAIQRFIDYNDIKTWVEAGIELHKLHKNDQCEFCGSDLSKERLVQLESHFNSDYKNFQDRLINAEKWLSEQYISLPSLPTLNDFYDEFRDEYAIACLSLEEATARLNNEIIKWQNTLKDKIRNQLETSLKVEFISDESIKSFNEAIAAIDKIIIKHNHKSHNFRDETNKAKKQLELHYASTEIKSFDFYKKKQEVLDRASKNQTLKSTIDGLKVEIRHLEDALSNESLGARQFNKSLHKFLGRDELAVRFNPSKKGYEILRNDSELVNGNLSEGEKTAIAFVYFITKLKENDNNIEDTIVVIDDPISSFDSNHLFHAFSFMKINCEKAKQLFVLTHNFTFFKLIRDWILRKNKATNENIANLYIVKATNSNPRSSTITDAEKALRLYNSEYHYIFSSLYLLKDKEVFETNDHFLAANLARKLLETFLSFKFPLKRGSFAGTFDAAIAASENSSDENKEKIRRFINEYSHNDSIETNEDFTENVLGEYASVIADIFDWIKELDKKHHQEMLDSIS